MDTKFLIIGSFIILMVLPEMKHAQRTELNASMKDTFSSYRVATVLNEPWIMETQNGYQGILVDLLEEVAKLANFSFVINEPPSKGYGRIKYMASEMQVNGVIGDIISGEADLAVADLIISDARSNVVSFSSPFATTGAQILLRKPNNNLRSLGMILLPFSPSLWICIVVAFLLTFAVIYVTEIFSYHALHQNETTSPNRLSFLESLHFTFVVLQLRGREDLRASVPSRFMTVCWWTFSLIILVAYTASLTGYLLSTSTSKPTIPFKTFEEMAGQSDVQYGGWFEMTLNVNDNIQRSMNRHISSRYTYYSSMDEAVKRVLDKERPFAAVVEGYNGQKAVNDNCELMLLQEQLFEIDYGIACARGLVGEVLCSDISMALRTLREGGILYKIMNRWWESSRTCEKVSENDFITSTLVGISNVNFQAMSISDVFVAFAILLIGLILSSVAIIRKCKQKKCKEKVAEDDKASETYNNHKPGTANTVPEHHPEDDYA